MIVIPAALAGVVAIVEPIVVGIAMGVAVSGGICAAGGAVSVIQDRGTVSEVAQSAADSAVSCAEDGTLGEAALLGGALGGVGHVVGPAMQVVDDVGRSVIQGMDDAARPVAQAIDDAIGPAIKQAQRNAAKVGKGIAKGANHAINTVRARFFQHLPKTTGPAGYVYLMDDAAGAHKIGMTTSPAQRLSQVQKTVGRELNFTCIISTDNMRALEAVLHATFSSQNLPNTGIGREWFKLNPAQVAAACSH